MTINKDHSGKRTSSWDTKISVCSASGRPVGRSDRSDTPSSILSSDSDIRFTRKLGSQYRCGCCIIAGFLLLLLVAAVSVYLAYTFILSKSPDEKVFRVNFRVTKGDEFDSKLADPSTEDFRIRARNYKERLNLIFKRSHLRPAFLKTDILALDGNENGDDLTVHFNVHFDARRKDVTARDLLNVLTREISLEQSVYLANLTIPVESLSVRESSLEAQSQPAASTSEATSLTVATESPPRKCALVQMQYCSGMPYNVTSYPNAVGHASYADVSDDLIAFREIVDSECYHLAHDFVCHVLQPPCRKSESDKLEDATILPCRSYCSDFMRNCGSRVPARFKDILDCSKFPELSGTGECTPKPGCVEDLHNGNLGSRVCDGIIDCPDLSDEMPCSYCERNYLHCGVGRSCIHPSKRCDGALDCPNGSDEKNCISLRPLAASAARSAIPSSHEVRYFKTGFVNLFREGIPNKLCMDDFNTTENEWRLSTLYGFANSLCRSASFERVTNYRIEEDVEADHNVPYVQLDGNFSFSLTSCPDKNVLHLECENLECGLQSLRSQFGVRGLNKMSNPGDWPWHVALLKDNVHLCDGTLVSEDWVLTTASCFQGQKKAEWIAMLGSIRLGSSSPWNQQRRIIGMIKSPVEGSSLVLVKMNEPVTYSDFVRPVCLPDSTTILANFTSCVALGWSRHNEQLLRTDVKITSMAKCENISITTVNSICGESTSQEQDCNEEEFAGSPLLCLIPETTKWMLAGVSNWRIACQKVGLERPRLYDKTLSNLDWIRETFLIV